MNTMMDNITYNIINALKELETLETGYPILVEFYDCIWTTDDKTVIWNTDNNKEDLINRNGETYSGELVEGCQRTKNYYIANIDMQSGPWITVIFKNEHRIRG